MKPKQLWKVFTYKGKEIFAYTIFGEGADEEEATQKWERLLKRMHWDNLYFKFNDNDACTYELMKEFEELPYKSKVIFSSKNYSDLPSLVHFKSAEKQGHVGIDLKTYHRYFNAVTWLNKGGEDLTK